MLNWCTNSLNIKHNDPTMIQKIVDAIEYGKGLFNTFMLRPEKYAKVDKETREHLEKTKEYIKSDVVEYEQENPNEIQLYFSTAGAPPIKFYDTLVDLKYKVESNFDDEGRSFLGNYKNGTKNIYNYPNTMKAFNKLPKSIQKDFSFIKTELIFTEEENKQ